MSSYTVTPGYWSNALWAVIVLQQIGAPVSANNITNMLHWMAAEEPSSDWAHNDNPLNASKGTDSTNGTGAQSNLLAGAVNTADMIGQSNMSGIKAALVADAPLQVFAQAVVSSPWASGHYGGTPSGISGTKAVVVGSTEEIPATPQTATILTIDPSLSNILGNLNTDLNTVSNPGTDASALAGAAGSSISDLAGLSSITTDLTSRAWWLRVGEFTLGLALIIGGIALFVATSKPGKEAISAGESAAVVAAA